MVREDLAGDQGGELGQHWSQSRNGDRHRGHRAVGRGGRERHPAHVRWLQARSCPDSSARRPDVLEQSRGPGTRGHRTRDRPHIRRREAVPDRQSALSPRAALGPAVVLVFARAAAIVLVFARAAAVVLVFAQAVEVVLVFAQAVEIASALVLASGVALAVSDALRPMGFRPAAH